HLPGSFVILGDGREEQHTALNVSRMTSVRWCQVLDLVHRLTQTVTAHQVAEPATGVACGAPYGGIGTAANPDRRIGLLLRARYQGDVVELVVAPCIRHVLLAQHPRQDL